MKSNKSLPNVYPIYYDNQKEKGLAIEPMDYEDGVYVMDEVRAFVVMSFPYTFFNPKEEEQVTQAFYRSTGSNSNEQFGDNISDMEARGTWIPTNGLVIQAGYKKSGVCVMNSPLILKKPFVSQAGTLLTRFHNDVQLAVVSYIMGGGIWNVPSKVKQLGDILVTLNFPDITREYPPGWINLTTKTVPALARDINRYIGESVSWNWHPMDVSFLQQAGIDKVDLNDDKFWIIQNGKHFIPAAIFQNPGILYNYQHNKTFQRFDPEVRKRITYQSIINPYTRCPNKDVKLELYPI